MSEEIRTTSSTGGQKGVKPERFGLLPTEGLNAIARVFGFGAQKYDDHNWRKGYEWSKSYDALMRHMTAFWGGETIDPESGLPHLAHAGFHIMVLLTWLETQGEGPSNDFDDRWASTSRRPQPDQAAPAEPRVTLQMPAAPSAEEVSALQQAINASLNRIAFHHPTRS